MAITTTTTTSPPTVNHVQHVTKGSSDQLLSKFAELDSDSARSRCRLQMIKAPAMMRRKRSKRVAAGLGARDVVTGGVDTALASIKRRRRSGGLQAEWNKALLPVSSRRSASLLRKMGIGKAEAGTAALLPALEKTWRKTIERASKIFIERHCSTHVRLISDVV